MTPEKISTEQMIALHCFFAEATAVGETRLGEIAGAETEVHVEEVRAIALTDFGEIGLRRSDDLVAGVIGRIEGVMSGALSIVLEPEDALRWSRLGGGDNPLETFVALGGAMFAGLTTALGEILEGYSDCQGAALAEDSELAMLVKTHAPPDTLVVSARLRIEVHDEVITAVTHMLVEPKSLLRVLSSLCATSH